MRITICDLCGKELDKWELRGEVNGISVRFAIQRIKSEDTRGVYWKNMEVCSKCMVKVLANVLNRDKDRTSCAPEPPQNNAEQASTDMQHAKVDIT